MRRSAIFRTSPRRPTGTSARGGAAGGGRPLARSGRSRSGRRATRLRDRRRTGWRSAAGAPLEVVVERGLATWWRLRVGDRLDVGQVGLVLIVGISVAPDNVAYPLAKTARVMLGEGPLPERFGAPPGQRFAVNTALLWAWGSVARRRPGVRRAPIVLRPAPAALPHARRVEALVGQAAGIIVALLVAFGVVATGLAGCCWAQARSPRFSARWTGSACSGRWGDARRRGRRARDARCAGGGAGRGDRAGGSAPSRAARADRARALTALNELPPSTGQLVALLALVWLSRGRPGRGRLGAAGLACGTARARGALLRGGDVAAPRRAAGRVDRDIPGQRARHARRSAMPRGGLVALGCTTRRRAALRFVWSSRSSARRLASSCCCSRSRRCCRRCAMTPPRSASATS